MNNSITSKAYNVVKYLAPVKPKRTFYQVDLTENTVLNLTEYCNGKPICFVNDPGLWEPGKVYRGPKSVIVQASSAAEAKRKVEEFMEDAEMQPFAAML